MKTRKNISSFFNVFVEFAAIWPWNSASVGYRLLWIIMGKSLQKFYLLTWELNLSQAAYGADANPCVHLKRNTWWRCSGITWNVKNFIYCSYSSYVMVHYIKRRHFGARDSVKRQTFALFVVCRERQKTCCPNTCCCLLLKTGLFVQVRIIIVCIYLMV